MFGERPDVASFFGSAAAYQKAVRSHRHGLFTLRTVLYHRGSTRRPAQAAWRARRVGGPPGRCAAGQSCPPGATGLITSNLCGLTRAHVLAYAASLHSPSMSPDGRTTPLETVLSRLSSLSVFFHDTTAWGWEEPRGAR